MKIAFWSNVHGQTTTTSNLLSVSSMIALNHGLKLLLTHNHYRHSTMEATFLGRMEAVGDLSTFEDMGIDAVSRFIKFNHVDSASVDNYATTVIKDRLDILTGTRQSDEAFYYKDINHVIELVLEAAKSTYDLLFVDVSAGNNDLSGKILSKADLVVVNLNQNTHVLEDYFSQPLGNQKIIYIISMYNANSNHNIKNLVRKYPSLKGNVVALPYCPGVLEAMNKADLLDFMARNKSCKKTDTHYGYIQAIKEIENKIMEAFTLYEGGEAVS